MPARNLMPNSPPTITRDALAQAVQDALPDLPRRDARDLVDLVLDVVVERLEAGEDVLITGFGRWSVREKGERVGRNPKTGETVTISARRVVVWRPSATLREAMRDGGVDPALADRKPE